VLKDDLWHQFPDAHTGECVGTCGKAQVGYVIFTVFLCMSNFILLNLVMAVLMQELQVSSLFHTVLQCVAVCCSALQELQVSSLSQTVLQCVAVCCSVLQELQVSSLSHTVLQCVAMCCSVLQELRVSSLSHTVLQCVAGAPGI